MLLCLNSVHHMWSALHQLTLKFPLEMTQMLQRNKPWFQEMMHSSFNRAQQDSVLRVVHVSSERCLELTNEKVKPFENQELKIICIIFMISDILTWMGFNILPTMFLRSIKIKLSLSPNMF